MELLLVDFFQKEAVKFWRGWEWATVGGSHALLGLSIVHPATEKHRLVSYEILWPEVSVTEDKSC